MVLNTLETEVDRLMREGQAAAKRGDKVMARALLTQLLEHDPHNEKAWMWLSGAVTDLAEQQTCLENVLIINPNNAQARKGLEFIVHKTHVPSRVLTNLTTDSPASDAPAGPAQESTPPNPASTQLIDPSYDGVMPFEFASQDEAPSAGQTQVSPSPAEEGSPWSRDSLEYTSPLASTDMVDHSLFGIPDPGSMNLPPWEQVDAAHVSPDLDAGFSDLDLYSGGSPAAYSPPDLESAIPDWVRGVESTSHTAVPNTADAGVPGVEPFSPFDMSAEPAAFAPKSGSLLPTEDVAAIGDGIDEWLSKFETGNIALPSSDPDFNVPNHQEATSPANDMDPFSVMGFDNMGPYGAMSLPSPDELPGAHNSRNSDSSQPWYLAATQDAQTYEADHGQHNAHTPAEQSYQAAAPAQSTAEPVAMMPCPNCREQVPDTSLACPNCRFNFFVHCPGCHELLETTDARPGVTESCQYCSVPVNRFELGHMYALDLNTPVVAEPTETNQAWIGTPLSAPPRRAINLAWVVDVLWLLAIALMVWALTQLPAWFNLTGLYN